MSRGSWTAVSGGLAEGGRVYRKESLPCVPPSFSFFSLVDKRVWALSPARLTLGADGEGYFYLTNGSDAPLEFETSANNYVLSIAQPSG